MDVTSICRLRVGVVFWQPRPSDWVATVACKATYRLVPGTAELHDAPELVNEEDRYFDDDAQASLFAPCDLVPLKPAVDVVVVGHAFSEGARPVASLVARLMMGGIDKSVEVWCPRGWRADGELVLGRPFTRRQLRYERAAEGPDAENPVGVRREGPLDERGLRRAPSLQPQGHVLEGQGDPVPPIGLGPIAPTWPARAGKLGRLVSTFGPGAWQSQPLPAEVDPDYFQCAPDDQRLEALRGDEAIHLQHLHPEHASLYTRLPGIRPRAVLERGDGRARVLDAAADTLWVDTDRAVATVVWRIQTPIAHPLEAGQIVVSMEDMRGRVVESVGVAQQIRAEDIAARWAALSVFTRPPDDPTITAFVELGPSLQPAPPPPPPPSEGLTPSAPDEGVPIEVPPPAIKRPQEETAPLAMSAGAVLPFSPAVMSAVAPVGPLPAIVDTPPGVAVGVGMAAGDGGAVPRGIGPTPAASPWAAGAPSDDERRSIGQRAVAGEAVHSPVPVDLRPEEPSRPAAEEKPRRPREIIELLWYDPAAMPRIRRNLHWKKIIADLKPRPSDDDFDGGLPPEQMRAAKDKRDIRGILARGEVLDLEGIQRAMEMAVAEDGSFVPPYVLTAGTLELLFDEVETLKALIVVASPFWANDMKLKDLLSAGSTFLRLPGAEKATGTAKLLDGRIRSALAGDPTRAGDDVDKQVEAALSAGRSYQICTSLGERWILGTLHQQRGQAGIRIHVPLNAADRLPSSCPFVARLIAEARPDAERQDGKTELFAVALASSVRRCS